MPIWHNMVFAKAKWIKSGQRASQLTFLVNHRFNLTSHAHTDIVHAVRIWEEWCKCNVAINWLLASLLDEEQKYGARESMWSISEWVFGTVIAIQGKSILFRSLSFSFDLSLLFSTYVQFMTWPILINPLTYQRFWISFEKATQTQLKMNRWKRKRNSFIGRLGIENLKFWTVELKT